MRWLFERTIEIAAWTAMVAAWVSAAMCVWSLVDWFGTLGKEPNDAMLRECCRYAAAFVGFSLALGALACIDRFIFDADERAK